MPDYLSVPIDSSQATPTTQIAPATNRPNQALYAYQGGVCLLGSDYGTAAKAQIPKVDAYGNQYVTVGTPAGGTAQVYAGQAAGATSTQYGQLAMGRADLPSPSTFYPQNLDMQMALNVHHKSKPTWRAIGRSISCANSGGNGTLSGTAITIFALYNGSSMVIRLNECAIYVPPSGNSANLAGLGSGVTYYPLFCELRRITAAYTGGTSISPVGGDSADVLASGVVVAQSPTITTAAANTFHRQDAIVTNETGLPWYGRGDHNEKTLVVRPGEGMAIACLSNGTINNAAGSGTTTASVDIEMVFTQASA